MTTARQRLLILAADKPDRFWCDVREVCGDDWRPMDSAPRTGKWILLWWPDVTDASFAGYYDRGWRDALSGGTWPGYPTHWRPLPPPPTTGAKE